MLASLGNLFFGGYMRIAIINAAILISDAIQKDTNLKNFYTEDTLRFLWGAIVLFTIADVIDLLFKW